MSRTAVLLAPLLFLGLAACTPQSGSRPVTPTEQGVSMQQKLVDVQTVRNYVHSTGTRQEALTAADDLVAWSERMKVLFPPAQVSKLYADLTPEVAQEAPVVMARLTTALRTTIQSGTPQQAGSALARLEQDGCGYCHRRPYQMRTP